MSHTGEIRQINLRCCGGGQAPPAVIAGWKRFQAFPTEARQAFWNVLGPTLVNPIEAERQELAQSFSRQHGIRGEDVNSVLHAMIFLITNACAGNLDDDTVRNDLIALSDGDTADADLIVAQYPAARTEIRRRLVEQTLISHGKVLIGLDWRVDQVTASSVGADIQTSILFLTLRYQEGVQVDQITLQLTPEALKDLKVFMQRFGQ